MTILKFLTTALFVLVLAGCQEKLYRKVVPSTNRQIRINQYGAYFNVTPVMGELMIGEALAIADDTLFLLGSSSVMKISTNDIRYIKLYLTRNRTDTYLKWSAVMTIPALLGTFAHSDYRGEFAGLGLATFGLGSVATMAESFRHGKVLLYPEDISNITELSNYCRFPRGIPKSLDINTLEGHLVNEKE